MNEQAAARAHYPGGTGDSPRAVPSRGARIQAAGLAVAGLLYASWILGTWINPALDVVNGYVSELAARDQPGSTFFRTGDALAGLCATAAALPRVWHRGDRWARTGGAGIVVFGLATAIDVAFTPMDCATFIDSGCSVRELAGTLSLPHQLHAVTSTVAGAGALVGMGGFALAARRAPGTSPPPRWGWAWLAVTGLATVATVIALLAGSWAGVLQRIQLTGISTWLVTLAMHWQARS